MNEAAAGETKADGRSSNRKVALLVGIALVILFAFFQDVVGNATGGGLLSIMSALDASNAKAPLIDVDGAGLRTIFMTAVIVVMIGASIYFNVDFKNRGITTVILLVTIGAGFVTDACCDESIMTHVLAQRGYARCENRDHAFGNGKSRVWFNDYVLHAADCPASRY